MSPRVKGLEQPQCIHTHRPFFEMACLPISHMCKELICCQGDKHISLGSCNQLGRSGSAQVLQNSQDWKGPSSQFSSISMQRLAPHTCSLVHKPQLCSLLVLLLHAMAQPHRCQIQIPFEQYKTMAPQGWPSNLLPALPRE